MVLVISLLVIGLTGCDGEELNTGTATQEQLNSCGGIEPLESQPEDSCGHCGLDQIICDGEEAITCDGDTRVNSCGGCEMLTIEPGVPCGNCGLDVYVCEGEEETICPSEVNCAPSVSELVIDPSPVNIGKEVVCTYVFVDQDDDVDQSIVEWLINGSTIASGSSWVAAGADGEVVTCRVTPFDGVENSEAVTTTAVLQRGMLDGNLQLVDLSDLVGPLPLDAEGPTQVLWQDQDWEHGSYQNPDWPLGGGDSVGYPTLIKNDRGLNPDDRYYLFYAHHDPMSGIGVAVADDIEGPYIKISSTDSKVLTVPNYNPAGPNVDDPSHYSSPSVVWNSEMADGEGRWCLYFHYYNHYHGAWTSDPTWPGMGYQMTTVAMTDDLSSHNWEIYEDPAYGSVSVWDIVPVLMTTDASWSDGASSYHALQRLVDGTWLAFLRGTNAATGYTELGFATSTDGLDWTHFPENPVIVADSLWTLPAQVYRPKFIGYLGPNDAGEDRYLVAWAETDGSASVIYSTTTDFVHFQRDKRGYANWGANDGGIVSARREGDVLYLFTGKNFYKMDLPVAP